MRLPNIPMPIFWLGIILLVSLSVAFFFQQLFFPPCCDADSYLAMARQYGTHGILAAQNTVRTFGYTWLLSLIIKASETLNLPLVLSIFAMQLLGYYFLTLYVTKVYDKYSMRIASAIYLAMCINIFLLPYLSITLTDAVYTMLALFIVVGVTQIELSNDLQKIPSKWIFIGSLSLCMAIAIRPASIWLVIPVFYCAIKIVVAKKANIFQVIFLILLGSVPLIVQLMLNVLNYKTFTFFPAANLGTDQLRWGIQNIKYATWLGDADNPAQNFYSSARLIGEAYNTKKFDISWYFENLDQSLKLIFFKFVAAFDFDYLMPYPYEKPRYSWLPSIFSFTLLWSSLYGIVLHLLTNKLRLLGDRFFPLIVLISWSAVSLTSALELRFVLPMIAYFIIISMIIFIFALEKHNRFHLKALVGGWILFLPVFYLISKYVREQSVIG